MSAILINCPATGQAIPTGIDADEVTFSILLRRAPDVLANVRCPHCDLNHPWHPRMAWLEGCPPRRPRDDEACGAADGAKPIRSS
jgi:hypothetical protein